VALLSRVAWLLPLARRMGARGSCAWGLLGASLLVGDLRARLVVAVPGALLLRVRAVGAGFVRACLGLSCWMGARRRRRVGLLCALLVVGKVRARFALAVRRALLLWV
jgi:hypothetical protein